MVELARELLAGEEAWVVGGAIRDELLGRPIVDLDVACRRPEEAARAYARRSGGAPFPLSEQHGAWRVALEDGRTVDFTPLRGTIEGDLATRDFTVNALARPLAGGEVVDPSGGLEDIELRSLRAVTETIFEDDPLRLLRAVRLEDELGFRLAPLTEELARAHAGLAPRPAGERILAELERLSPAGFRRLDELGLLAPLGGSLERGDLLEASDSADFRLAVVFGPDLRRYPISNERKRLLRALARAERPRDGSARAIHRFRRVTEPWAVEALAFVGASELAPAVEQARANEPDEPLLRGDELGLPPGPEIGRLLAAVAEERAAGIISTREEALEFVRRTASGA
jgi:tRNA nucleotidyltransferase/poly(A) polymerase